MPPPDIELTFRDGGTGDAGDPYTGLDRFGRLVETLWKQPGSDDVRVQSTYGRNPVGGVVWRKDEQAHAADVATEDNYYWYDALQQVKERQRGDLTDPASPAPISDLQQQEDWTYDATGNWAAYDNTSPTNAQTRTHNTANEITDIAAAPGAITPAYDPVGNMLTLPKEPGLATGQYDLTWDAWNRLVAVKDGITSVASYTYDGLTRRLTKANAAETRHYYYNAAWRALEERVEGAAYLVDRQYSWGLRDRWDLLRRKRSVTGSLNETRFVLRDYLDPVAIVNDSGTVVERYAYDAFGAVRFLAPDYTSLSGSSCDWNFLFHAEFRDTETSLYNYGYRYYDAELGRWMSRDPIEEAAGINLYGYVTNRPIEMFDALGLDGIITKIVGDVRVIRKEGDTLKIARIGDIVQFGGSVRTGINSRATISFPSNFDDRPEKNIEEITVEVEDKSVKVEEKSADSTGPRVRFKEDMELNKPKIVKRPATVVDIPECEVTRIGSTTHFKLTDPRKKSKEGEPTVNPSKIDKTKPNLLGNPVSTIPG